MTKGKRVRLWSLPAMQRLRALILLGGCFGLGSLLGNLFSARLEGEGTEALRAYLEGYLTMMEAGGGSDWRDLVLPAMRWPAAVTLLRFTVLGLLLVPLALGSKGFLLSFAVSGFARSYGWRGLGAAMLVFGLPQALETAVLFVLGVESWAAAQVSSAGTELPGWDRGVRRCVVCWLLLAASVLLQALMAEPSAGLLKAVLG